MQTRAFERVYSLGLKDFSLPGNEIGPNDQDGRRELCNVLVQGGPLVKFGGHSISIRDTDGRIVFDSGSLLDREAIRLGVYDDGRSDNKGVEPEGLAPLHIEGRLLAFIGLERTLTSAIAVFDITDLDAAQSIDMIVSDGDVPPEGLTAIKVGDRHFVAVAHEVSDTTLLFEIQRFKGQGVAR